MEKSAIVFSAIALICLFFSVQTGQAQNIGNVENVVTIDTLPSNSIYKQIWQPFIAQWKEDYYVVSYGLKLKGKSDLGTLVCSYTTDGGETWSAPITIFDHTRPNGSQRFAYANTVLFRPEGQNVIWCFAMRAPIYYADSEDSELCAAYSADGGLSWQQVELSNKFPSPLITNAGVVTVNRDGKKKYLLPVHRNTVRHDPRGDREQFVLESTNLLEWELAGYVPHPDHVWIHEGNIAEGENPGELKMVMRTAKKHKRKEQLDVPRAYSSVSTDGGKTWSMAKPEPALWNSRAKGFYGKDSKGRHIYVYNPGPSGERKQLMYTVKEPGNDWSEPELFYWKNNRNSYATLIEKKPGVFLCVWDSSNDIDVKRSVIRFGILNLNK